MNSHKIIYFKALYTFMLCDALINSNITLSCENYISINYYVWMDGWVGGWVGGWMDGWMDGSMDGCEDGWM